MSLLRVQASVPAVPPRSPQDTAKALKTLNKAAPPKPSRRRRVLAALGVLGAIVAYISLRSGPASTLTVYATPSVPGFVTIDGSRAGALGERLQVPAGTHHLGYEADGWTTAGQEIDLAADEERAITIVLAPEPALVVFDLRTPGTTLRFDNKLIVAPQDELKVPPGQHRLTATRPGFAKLSLELMLARGERRSITVTLSPIAVREVTRTAVLGGWSEPVLVPPHTVFTIAANGRFRLRVGQDVFLVQTGSSINLADVRSGSLQVKAVDDQSVEVHFYLRPKDD